MVAAGPLMVAAGPLVVAASPLVVAAGPLVVFDWRFGRAVVCRFWGGGLVVICRLGRPAGSWGLSSSCGGFAWGVLCG